MKLRATLKTEVGLEGDGVLIVQEDSNGEQQYVELSARQALLVGEELLRLARELEEGSDVIS
ncbi:TPA: hypothetical protein ACKPYC_003365 [Pseudomonas aeruginosa]|uniref:hypothetical protein n=1 Tax=Pseudomonas aeruginosa TaxID=287 RepID=UPI00053DAE00|nr:hypothetical protein [Pseudomonas aeruginosa]AYW43943.1 hypothetical protein DL351_33010 [Pseudomonas aeruginosa]MBG6736227.1 hypothetical protein [Pseudomonas aeruginosa]MBH3536838.1 hypothetical protein [Pseudomonas aeruginosa]MBH3791232.1 hypothetical protein [Pseudomonas aeruginosa]MBI8222096.1 hypothetical protein [Pseudomonas aeruginosa]